MRSNVAGAILPILFGCILALIGSCAGWAAFNEMPRDVNDLICAALSGLAAAVMLALAVLCFRQAVREVRLTTDTGKVLRVLCNDLDAGAQEIADLYKRRWAIELFFRWVNQILKITRFVGTSDNAVRIQIAFALIAFLLLRMAQALQKDIPSPIVFSRLIRANLMHRRSIDELLKPPPILEDQHQMGLSLC